MKRVWLVLIAGAALARKAPSQPHHGGAALDPSHWFALRPGLLRVYEVRSQKQADDADDEGPGAGASCEVLSAQPRSGGDGSMTESCTMIVDRKPKSATELTYALRDDGIWNTAVRPAGAKEATAISRLVLPGPLRVGSSWKESRGPVQLDRSVRSAGTSCHAAGRAFADCLVLAVTERQGKRVVRHYEETYAAGVGLVEDGQWELIDVKGL